MEIKKAIDELQINLYTTLSSKIGNKGMPVVSVNGKGVVKVYVDGIANNEVGCKPASNIFKIKVKKNGDMLIKTKMVLASSELYNSLITTVLTRVFSEYTLDV